MRLLALGILISVLGLLGFAHLAAKSRTERGGNIIEISGIYYKKIDIYVADVIVDVSSVYDIGVVLREASSSDRVVFHIVGHGGDTETALVLINDIRSTKAHVSMLVEGPSYSSHAYLAASVKDMTILPNAYLMFHTSSGYGADCTIMSGTDRTVSNVEHCNRLLRFNLFEVNKYIDSIGFLSLEEKKFIKTGHDVYITSEEYAYRAKHHTVSEKSRIEMIDDMVVPAIVTIPPLQLNRSPK